MGFWWLMALGQDDVHWESLYSAALMCSRILQLWNLGSARVDENLHKYLGPLCKCFDLTF